MFYDFFFFLINYLWVWLNVYIVKIGKCLKIYIFNFKFDLIRVLNIFLFLIFVIVRIKEVWEDLFLIWFIIFVNMINNYVKDIDFLKFEVKGLELLVI